jgi:hypothetical protein
MPVELLRAINLDHLVPLRARTPSGKNLLEYYQECHPKEPRCQLITRSYGISGDAIFYEFYGQQVSPSHIGICEFLPNALTKPESEVAALSLEQVFGIAGQDAFTVDWGRPRGRGVYWDTVNDRIVAIANKGLMLSIRGTNLVEAAVVLPLLFDEALKHSPKFEKGISWVEAAVVSPQEYWSQAASPLRVRTTVRNLKNFVPGIYNKSASLAFELALANRLH